jgi:magnesium transporter
MQTIYHRTIRDTSLQIVDKPKKGSWIRVVEPSKDELKELEKQYSLDSDLLDDGVDLYESPRLEHEDGVVYIYVRYCRPHGDTTSTHPLLLVLTADNVITVSRLTSEPVEKLLKTEQIVTTQKVRLVMEILEQVNKGYRTYLNDVTRRILSSRNKLQRKIMSNDDVLTFIDIEEDLNEFLAALQPYSLVLHALVTGKYIKMHERDEDIIEDLQLSTSELIELTKSRLKTMQNIRDAYSTIAANNLNQIFKRLTSIAIFMSVPTIIGGLYGMNIALPLDHHPHAFLIVLGSIGVIVSLFIAYFHRHKWL